MPQTSLLAPERPGFACALDRHVLSSVTDALETAPGVLLAANVSADSLSCTYVGGEILDRRPALGRRRVREVTGTALAVDTSRAVAFVAQFRSLGGRIGIDDYGAGLASIRHLLVFLSDISKIARSWRNGWFMPPPIAVAAR